MEDQYVVLLEKVLTENRRLREAIEARDNEQRNMLQELASKMESGLPQERASRKRTRKIPIPQPCRQDFRKMYKALKGNEDFQHFKLDESFLANANQEATHRVIEAVVADHGGTNKCPWSAAEMKGAAATYFKSLCNASTRAKKGKLEAHRTLCRRQGRMRDKIQRRLASLRKMPWSEEKKAMLEGVIKSPTYTSSDESDFSEDENGESRVAGYLVKRLPWERSALTKAKKALDDNYIRSLNPRARVNLMRRDAHQRFSARHLPPNGPEWAVRTEEAVLTARTAATPSTRPPPVPTASHRTCPTTVTPPTRAHPTTNSSHSTMATPSRSSHQRSVALPSQTNHQSSGNSPPTTAVPSTQSHPPSTVRSHPTMATPSLSAPSTRISPPVAASTLPSATLHPTPRTSKKKSVNSKKNINRRLTVSPVY
ncbi:uncharacterized protein [Montipora foliosa]|uniref:uncharacterized protein isoform X1 n=2 Tax=Montipora foliosa TaxID=591990 RepID=UPI0035F17E68